MISIRPAIIQDAALILKFVKELAKYGKAPHAVEATVHSYETTIFAKDSFVHGLIIEQKTIPIGFAVYFFNYSTWQGKPGLYLEDLYISPDYRNHGAGKTLLRHLAQIALGKNCGRFEWAVLDWNRPAIQFYESIGARAHEEWVKYRLDGNALKSFAQSDH